MADEIVTVLDRPSNIEYLRGAVMQGRNSALPITTERRIHRIVFHSEANDLRSSLTVPHPDT